MDITNLTPEQIEKAKACTSAGELMELAKAEGMELTDEQLDTISGGMEWYQACDPHECNKLGAIYGR